MTTVGVLALQGAFEAHRSVFRSLGIPTVPVRTVDDLQGVQALVFPGGESSAMLRLMEPQGLLEAIGERVSQGLPVLATCAGVILLAVGVSPPQATLGLLDIDIERNAYGRQVFSSIEHLRVTPGLKDVIDEGGVFIRAPRISRVGRGLEVLAWRGDDPVLVRSPGILAATFHPELGKGAGIHKLFLQETIRGAG
jgi:5'-phosphate synthase pdxT subunit